MTSGTNDGSAGENSTGTTEENPIAYRFFNINSDYKGPIPIFYEKFYGPDFYSTVDLQGNRTYYDSKTGKIISNPNAVLSVQSDVTTVTALVKNQTKYLPVVVNSPYGPLLQLTDFTSAKDTNKYIYIGSKLTVTDTNGDYVGYTGYYQPTEAAKTTINYQNTGSTKDGKFLAGGSPIPAGDPNEYKWNLPPHKWSLPYFAGKDPSSVPQKFIGNQSSDRYRRGRIWWKFSDPNVDLVQDSDKGLTTVSAGTADRKYGFQFLWNPETFGTQVAVQMDATPTAGDRFLGAVGAFPATETITFNVRLDRTNDFACANSYFKRPSNMLGVNPVDSNVDVNNYITKADVVKFVDFYKVNGGWTGADVGGTEGFSATIEAKLIDLFQRGTIADIEFLYRAINGPGPGDGSLWVNNRGIKTSDIGFLQPTLLNIDIGPLSYQGYVTSMSVNHIGFTRDMIPMRSDVTISLNLLATAGLASTYATNHAEK